MDIELLLTSILGGLIGAAIPAIAFYRFRARIARGMIRLLIKAAPEEMREAVLGIFCEWEDKKDKDGNKVRHYKPSPFLLGFFESVLPVVVEIAWRSIGGKLGNLPVGPDGKLNMLAPVMKRMMDGKKVGFEDFMPFLVEKIAPVAQAFVAKFTGAGQPPAPAATAAPATPPPAKLTPLG